MFVPFRAASMNYRRGVSPVPSAAQDVCLCKLRRKSFVIVMLSVCPAGDTGATHAFIHSEPALPINQMQRYPVGIGERVTCQARRCRPALSPLILLTGARAASIAVPH